MKGKAALFTGPKQPHQIVELETPELEPGSILVRVTAAGICGSDLHIWRGDMPAALYQRGPRVSGHEMTGQVAALGPGVSTDSLGRPLQEGDRIAYMYFYPCRRCYQCTRGQLAACPNKLAQGAGMGSSPGFTGAYAEYYYLRPGHFVYKVPDDLPDEMVAPVNCALSQVIFGLNQAGLRFGDTIVIQGAGGLGINATAVARDMGADRVIVIDAVPARLELAKRFGADEVVSLQEYPEPMARIAKVMELTQGRGADVVAEFVGLPSAIPEGLAMTRPGGTYLEIGNISIGQTATLDPAAQLVFGSKKIVGVVMYEPWVIPAALDFLVRNRSRYPFDQVVSHKFPLEQIDEAFQQAEWQGREGDQTQIRRAVITP
ncbi:MAG TPA: zinc-binding dehydrogenase [Dehalococcoidia bacterium]